MALPEIYHIHKRMEGEQKWSNGEVVHELPKRQDGTSPSVTTGPNGASLLLIHARERARAICEETNVESVEIRKVITAYQKKVIIAEEGQIT